VLKGSPKQTRLASPQIHVPNHQAWRPEMFPKQIAYFEDTTRFRLASGPRYCGKSRVVDHTLLRHAWGTRNGRVAIFSKSVRNAKVGVWSDLTSFIIQEWLDSKLTSPLGHRFDWTKEPWVDGATRMHYFRIRNYYGEESEIQLHSLDFDGDVAAKLMNTSFSCIYFSELQNFSSEDVFKISILQLRMDGLPYHKHLWLADTNPPEEGPDHFAYRLWYQLRAQDEPPADAVTDEQIQAFRDYQRQFGLHEFTIDDNIFGDQNIVRDLKNAYRDDPIGWDRFILGKWTKAQSSKEKHFHGIWKPEIHVMGDCSSPKKDDWQVLQPTAECTTLLGGWDIGDCNHAFVIEEPIIMEGDLIGFMQLDELVWIGIQEPIVDFLVECFEKIEAIEKLIGHPVEWRHWSDTSAWRFSARASDVDAMLVEKLSEGKVQLLSAGSAKQRQSIRRRIKLMQDLLKQGRELVSAHCFHAIEMYENLRSGKLAPDGTGEVIVKGSPQKHIFDAKSYLRFCELFTEISTGPTKPSTGPKILQVALGA